MSALPSSNSPALKFEVVAIQGRARVARMKLPHYTAQTPMFMPGNTYHLENRPGSDVVSQMGGLHEFINWPRGMLTDSGGFQMVSLLHLAEITEEGVTFQSPVDGADIIMALDDVVPAFSQNPARFEEATYRTTRWIDRCIAAHSRPNEQNLFAIVQGGLDPKLRAISIKELVERDTPGYAIGGLAGGLPANKPRYVMGIGYPLDVVVCSALGADMYDSVYPTRTARFGVALVPEGVLKLRHAGFAQDFRNSREKSLSFYPKALPETKLEG
eukprot:gene31400-6566_t